MTQFNAPTYDLQRPTGQCALTGKTLTAGEAYIATLVECDPNQPVGEGKAGNALGFVRLDVSLEAWQSGQRPPRLFSHWRTHVPQPNEKRKLFVDDTVLLALFRRLGEQEQAERAAFRFVLGLILMRKKILRYEGSRQRPGTEGGTEGGAEGQVQEFWSLGVRGEDEKLELFNPQMDEAKIQQVTEQLGEVLEAEL
ncbi:MAG: hypothetical protein IT443_13640 [Phycisphaeraceae bacterium]|nr:hypothetical protein [Phycisphaeraceae bacterium]